MGASGSIGAKALDCVEYLNRFYAASGQDEKKYRVVGVSVKENCQALLDAHRRFSPEALVAVDEKACDFLAKEIKKIPKNQTNTSVEIFSDLERALRSVKYDVLLNAISGVAGLLGTAMAVKAGKKVLLANKESLVAAGEWLCQKAQQTGSEIIPIDSEHSALLHLMHGRKKQDVRKLILTASGGPFWGKKVIAPSIEQVLNHPNWSMGKKITVDSATMMNKGFEVIEAQHLFGVGYKNIEIVIHPQSIVHSLIETIDGEKYAQMSAPEMGHAIQNALTYPELAPSPYPHFDLMSLGEINFFPMDFQRFPLAKIAYECGEKGKSWPAALNAANDQAVFLFLAKVIDFESILTIVQKILDHHDAFVPRDVEQLIELDRKITRQIHHEYKIEV